MSLVSVKEAIKKIVEEYPVKVVISNPLEKSADYKKIEIILKELKGTKCYQVAKYTKTQVFHENISCEEVGEALERLSSEYKQINSFSEKSEFEVKINRNREAFVNRKQSMRPKTLAGAGNNNRKKNYILEEGMDIPAFIDLGIFTKERKIVNSKYDKFRQINRFTEIVDDALSSYSKDSINIIDFGCGKSYLTFVMYYYLTEIKKLNVRILGLDLKADVIRKCNSIAEKYGYKDLKFEIGDINGFKPDFDVDMVVTLHACDTATDYALFNAISWNTSIILSVPCCQHEVNKQIKSDRLSALTKYGIVKERMAALMTDSVRGCMLEYKGYKTDVMEFVDFEHSPKNILIRAVKGNVSDKKRMKSYEEAVNLMEEFSFEQKLFTLLKA